MVSPTSIPRTTPHYSTRGEIIHPRQSPQVQYHRCHARHHRMGNVVYIRTDGKGQGSSDLRETKGEVETISSSRNPPIHISPRQVKTSGFGNDVHSHSGIALAPLPTRPFISGGTSEGQNWDERGSAIGWPDDPSLESTNHAAQPTVHERRDPLAHGGDFTHGSHHDAPHPVVPRMHGREVLVNPFDPHQHLRTRSLSGFHRNTTVEDPDTFRTAVTHH